MEKDEILKEITDKYLGSEEFNGYALYNLENEIQKIIELVKDEKIEINFGDGHPNFHIKAFDCDNVDTQLKKIDSMGLNNSCAYPTKKYLKTKIPYGKYKDKPFTRLIALGEATLNFAVFDLSVLEIYRNDPRFSYSTDDVGGQINISDDYYKSTEVKSSDKILLQTFGFCYEKEKFNRAVAVFYRYLANLSDEHQKIWHAKLLSGDYFLHPDYARSSMGHWPEKVSIFEAFIEELKTINEFSKLMNRPTLFKEDFKNNKPRDFAFLIRPTLKEFNSFIHLLDKMISDNINKDFFKDDIELESEEIRTDGKIIVRQKATITLLKDWLDKVVKFPDPKPKEEMIKTIRNIRTMRQHPAHKVDEDVFDQKYFKEQRELVIEAYNAIRTLRLILANNPRTRSYEVPDWLYKGEIWSF
ncbi:MAG: AAA family ATPase [Candidatus Aenigmarchaeota archaeon]|nr:AAA family ATPase [Candidatus Aenigmarchaeota archaeon]